MAQNNIPAEDLLMDYFQKTIALQEQVMAARQERDVLIASLVGMNEQGQEPTPEYIQKQQRLNFVQSLLEKWEPVYQERLRVCAEINKPRPHKKKGRK